MANPFFRTKEINVIAILLFRKRNYTKQYKITKSKQGFQEKNGTTRKRENIKEDERKRTHDDGRRIRQSRNTS